MGVRATQTIAEQGARRRRRAPPQLEVNEGKLLRPPPRPGIVPRTELVDRLRASSSAAVAVVVAPAGYGKTSLLSEWAERDRRPVAWVSVDDNDADPVAFLAHVATALDRLEDLDPAVFMAINSPGASNPGRIVRRLTGALATRRRPFVLVLDDLDRCREPLTLDAVATLAEHLPRRSLIAIAARRVPDVRLPRLRAEGRLLEIGAKDLAMSESDARKLLQAAGAKVTAPQVRELTKATEGWPVGLYLAALSLQERGGTGAPSVRFTGNDRYVADYIRSEVLRPLSRERQRFLMRTSILERLNGSLCDAVLGRSGSARTLESIEERNLLLAPLDRERKWYRYHRLFVDVLRSELARREPDAIPELHRRAADWFEGLGMIEDAMTHAHAGGDVDRTADLLQHVGVRAYQSGRNAMLSGWLARLGDDVIARNPGLAIAAALTAALTGDPTSAERWARVVSRAPTGPSLHGTASLRSSRAIVSAIMARAGAEAMLRDGAIAVEEEPESSPFRAAALAFLGIALLITGDVDRADDTFAEAAETGLRTGALPGASTALAERSLIATARGEREAAEEYAEAARSIVLQGNLMEHITTAPVRAASARVALRAGDIDRALEELTAAQQLRPILTYAFPTISVQTRLELARVHVGLADVAGARTLLAEVDEILTRRPDLGTLTTQAAELRTHIGSVRGGRSPGPSTLTSAELRVLTLLPTYLSFRGIGERLFVSQNTVKTQAISIYRKLGVSARSDAVQRARELGLLEP